MDKINLHIVNVTGSLDRFMESIHEEFALTSGKIKNVIPFKNVDIVVWEYPQWAIYEYGVGGHTMTPHTIVISLDTKNPHITNNFRINFSQTLIHESFHIVRGQVLGIEDPTRLEVSIREGLAEHFEMELGNKKPEIWDTALSASQLEKFAEVAKNDKTTNYYSYDWLFGNSELNIPKWTGYSVGFYLVGEYLHKHPDKKPSDLYAMPAEDFI